MAEAFRTFALDQPATARTLKARILKHRQDRLTEIGEGYAQDWGDYKHRAGVIEGLLLAAGICEELEKEQETR